MSRDGYRAADKDAFTRATRHGGGRDAGGLTIEERRADGIPLVKWHSVMRFAFNCPYWPGTPACGMGDMYTDYPTEDSARKAWKDHAAMRHKGQKVGWPNHVVGCRPPSLPRGKTSTADNDGQESLF